MPLYIFILILSVHSCVAEYKNKFKNVVLITGRKGGRFQHTLALMICILFFHKGFIEGANSLKMCVRCLRIRRFVLYRFVLDRVCRFDLCIGFDRPG